MAKDQDNADPKGLIRDSYRIDGISAPECRSIFLDWAISVPVGVDAKPLIGALLARHGDVEPDHPMTEILRASLEEAKPAKRRGGAGGRRR